MYRAFLETVNRCPDKAAVSIIYNRLEAEKALKRRRKGKKRRAEDRTFYPAPKDLTWSQLSKVVETYQKSITQAVTRNSPRQAPCSVLFCACSGSFRLLVAWLATLGTGNIPVFANPLFTAKQLKEVFTEARPALVFMEIRAVNRRHLLGPNKEVLKELVGNIPAVSLDELQLECTVPWAYFLSRGSACREQLADSKGKMYVGRRGRTSILKAEDKGTSTGKVVYVTWHDGSARAINFTSRELCAYTEAVACKAKISQCDRLISSLPVHHVAEQLVALQLPVVTGCSVAYYTATRYTGVSDFVDFLHATRPTVFGTTPRMWERLCFYSLYTWKKKSRVQDVLVKVIKRCKNRGTASQSIEAEFLPVASPNGKHKKRVCEKRENPQRLLGLENTHLAYCYREQRPKVSRFFAMRGLKIACVDGFPEAGGMCTFRRSTKDGARSLLGTEEDSHKQPKWRKERMLLTQRGDYIPKDFTESLFFKYNRDSIIEKATLVSNTQQSIGVVIYVNGKVASELLAVPVNRLWRSRDLSEYLRDIVNKVNENLQYDQRISCFTQCIICKGDENMEEGTWSEKEIIAQMYREENLI